MGCFSCFSTKDGENRIERKQRDSNKCENQVVPLPPHIDASPSLLGANMMRTKSDLGPNRISLGQKEGSSDKITVQTFTFKEIAAATNNFSEHCFIGEGGFGRVYKGCLKSTGQVVAVKQLNQSGLQGNREFLVEVLMLILLHHPNLVNLIGYCAEEEQRLLVYEYVSLGSLEDHLHGLPLDKEPLDWNTRMKIAVGAAKGLKYLHNQANPPVIYRDFKPSNILLDEGFHPKISDFGMAKLGPVGDKSHVSTRVMGTYGYCAPEYFLTGQLTVESDVYSFGVVLLELITGRMAVDNTKEQGERNLVLWARTMFSERRKVSMMADPALQGHYPMRGLYQALSVASMCTQEDSIARPLIADVVTVLTYLASHAYDPNALPCSTMQPGGVGDERSGNGDERPERMVEKNRDGRVDVSGIDDSLREPDRILNKDCGKARAVAEAKLWAQNWREKNGGGVATTLT